MSSVIHMETEQARAVAKQLDRVGSDIQQDITVVGSKLRGLDWQSPARETFITEYAQLESKIIERATEAIALGVRLQSEVDEWEQAASTLVASTVTGEQRRNQAIRDARKSIRDVWNDMSGVERIEWLENWYKDLCKKLGIPSVDFRVKDLKDPENGDWRGVYNNGGIFGWFRSLTIDLDNVNGKDPFQVLETVAHETRHQYQHYLVEHPNERPPEISEEQIKSWKENFENYKRYEDNPESYEKQPVESDARGAGAAAVDDYVNQRAEVI